MNADVSATIFRAIGLVQPDIVFDGDALWDFGFMWIGRPPSPYRPPYPTIIWPAMGPGGAFSLTTHP